jgi:hypothetical protein
MGRRLRFALLLVVPVALVVFVATSAAWLGMMYLLTKAQRTQWIYAHPMTTAVTYWGGTAVIALALTQRLAGSLSARRSRPTSERAA